MTRAVFFVAALAAISISHSSWASQADADDAPKAQIIPNTGQLITPTAPTGSRFESLNPNLSDFPEYVAGQAVTTVVSPDGKTLLILTSGYNLLKGKSGKALPADSNEYVFAYDISKQPAVKRQVIKVPNTYNGIVFDPFGDAFYVTGGVNDNVHIYYRRSSGWAERKYSPVTLGHSTGQGLDVLPEAAGVAISRNGKTLVVANYYNDSISLLTKSHKQWAKSGELDLRPGKENPSESGVPGGEYPFWVVVKGNDTAYISSMRDREVDVVSLTGTPAVTDRIHVAGQPNKMTLDSSQTLLYVAEDESDSVDVIDTTSNKVKETIAVGAPAGLLPGSRAKFTGNNTNSVTLSPDEKTLYVTNGNTSDVAVVNLNSRSGTPAVAGLIPSGWYPNSVSVSRNGKFLYVVNGKSPTGPNGGHCHGLTHDESAACAATNRYNLQLIKAGFQSFPVPSAGELTSLTQQVAVNNNFNRSLTAADKQTIAVLRNKIEHVIYIIKENRTYDQVLGDLDRGNGDPKLAEFGRRTTPNFHDLADTFVTLDNFYDRSEVSMDGWSWSVSARAPDTVEKQTWVKYASRGLSYDSEGTNRNVNISYPTLAERLKANPLTPADPNILPGTAGAASPDGPDDQINGGYLWNGALRAGLSIRNYGFFIDLARYNLTGQRSRFGIPELRDPYKTKTQVAYAADAALRPCTDIYFRGFDNSFPDYYRFKEWEREFDTNFSKGGLPRLEFVRFMHDHTGNFSTAIDKVNTVELQQADNDYAVGLLIEKISKSQYRDNTLVFAIEDDSQDGADHVDSHRSTAFIAGPYVKQGQVVSSAYNTVDLIRTIEEVLGIGPLNLSDAVAVPMTDAFDTKLSTWSFTAHPSALLAQTGLPIPSAAFAGLQPLFPTHDAKYWADATKGMDFSAEDRMNFDQYNRILWKGLMGDKPYPAEPTRLDLRRNRAELLSRYGVETEPIRRRAVGSKE